MDTVLVPIGGGGLFAGVALALKETNPKIRVVGVQSEGCDAAVQSFHAGHLVPSSVPIRTICDGIAVKTPSPRTFEYLEKYADDIVTVPDTAVSAAILLLLERAKLVVEPSGAAGLAALLAHRTGDIDVPDARVLVRTAVLDCLWDLFEKLMSAEGEVFREGSD